MLGTAWFPEDKKGGNALGACEGKSLSVEILSLPKLRPFTHISATCSSHTFYAIWVLGILHLNKVCIPKTLVLVFRRCTAFTFPGYAVQYNRSNIRLGIGRAGDYPGTLLIIPLTLSKMFFILNLSCTIFQWEGLEGCYRQLLSYNAV